MLVPLIKTWLRSSMRPIHQFLLTLGFTAAAFGQHLSHPISLPQGSLQRGPRAISSPDSVSVLAVMVQFQKDNDQAKDGNGQFDLSIAASQFIDAPPRDSAYFGGHLTFLSNYFNKSSKGKTSVRWTLLNGVYTLPGVMADYSPRSGESNLRLANLARDTWRLVDSSGRVSDFSKYNCFVLFHAGVGHDVDLVSLLGFDPAPHDIPSLYLGPGAFTSLLGGGIPVNGGAHVITNTVILPETENRTLQSAIGPAPLNLGINGLLCASLGSYLGLPDLFDTHSGASAIGRFGLMDGQSIFSFSGAFPPEPSAWEKYWLGWVNPIVVPAGTTSLNLPAVALADTIYRIPISDAEYFLIENRSRDPHRTGQTVTSLYNGVTRRQHFVRDTAGFTFDTITLITGTVTDVDVLDWSLPGGVDVDGTFYDGGILIWHIDESVINATIGQNAVNADSSHRGVDLEEADGSQDIGHTYDITSPGLGSESGTALDFWFQGNLSPVNKNEFSAVTFPNSNSDLGALSHVTVNKFSGRGPRMTAQVIRGDAVAPVQGFPRQLGETIPPNALGVADFGSGPDIVVGTTGFPLPKYTTGGVVDPPQVGGKIYLLPADSTGHVALFRSSGVVAVSSTQSRGFDFAPAVADINGDGIPDIIAPEADATGGNGGVRAISLRSATPDSLASQMFLTPITGGPWTAPVISDSLIAVGNLGPTVYFLKFDGTVADSVIPSSSRARVSGVSRWSGANAFVVTCFDGTILLTRRTTAGNRARPDVERKFGYPISTAASTGLFGPDSVQGRVLTAFTTSDGSLYLVDSTLTPVSGFPASAGATGQPVLADVDGDGLRDIIVCSTQGISAYNLSGVLLDNFPARVPDSYSLQSPLVGDVDGDGNVEIVALSGNGLAYAFTGKARPVSGWPLSIGPGVPAGAGLGESGAIMTVNGKIVLAASSGDGSMSAWVTGHYSGLPDARKYPWPQYGRDSRHSGLDLTPLAPSPAVSAFFPPDRVYNWPNPVYSGRTFFRYFVSQNSSVNIKIFDMAGDLVTTLNGQGMGGVDNEISWDVSHIQSGVYFARVEASSGGSSGIKIVKVAVVK
jgi:hypothetical protein